MLSISLSTTHVAYILCMISQAFTRMHTCTCIQLSTAAQVQRCLDLIAGLENGLERLNGLRNTAGAPFHPVFQLYSSLSNSVRLQTVSFIAVMATSYYRTHLLNLSKDASDLRLLGECMNEGPYKINLARNRLASK